MTPRTGQRGTSHIAHPSRYQWRRLVPCNANSATHEDSACNRVHLGMILLGHVRPLYGSTPGLLQSSDLPCIARVLHASREQVHPHRCPRSGTRSQLRRQMSHSTAAAVARTRARTRTRTLRHEPSARMTAATPKTRNVDSPTMSLPCPAVLARLQQRHRSLQDTP